MPLLSAKFLVPTVYGVASVVVYIIVAAAIITRWKLFKGSYFKLYLAQSVFNIITYLNSFVTLRLPQNTCAECTLAPIFKSRHFFGLEFFHLIHFHMGFVQYLMIMFVSANRLSMMLWPVTYEQHWNYLTIVSILIAALLPLASTFQFLFGYSFYAYKHSTDNFSTQSTIDMVTIYNVLVIFMVVFTLISAVFNAVAIGLLCFKGSSGKQRSERMLLLHSSLIFLTMLFAATITVFKSFGVDESTRNSFLYVAGEQLLPFVSDGLTLVPPFLLLISSSSLRRAVKSMLFSKRGTGKKTNGKKYERMLLLHSCLIFLTMLFAATITMFNRLGVNDTFLAIAGEQLLPFVSDGLTLVPPFLLLLSSSSLRKVLKSMLFPRSTAVSMISNVSRPKN